MIRKTFYNKKSVMKNIILFFSCVFSLGMTQVVEDPSPTTIDLKKVENFFVQELNKYRVSLGVNPLKQNDKFYYVAENQVDFLIKLNTEINRITDSLCYTMLIGHGQKEEYEFNNKKIKFEKSEIKEDIYDRLGKVNYKHVGENVQFNCFSGDQFNSEKQENNEMKFAKIILECFKKSPMHEKIQTNIIYKEITCCVKKMPWFMKIDSNVVIKTDVYFIAVFFYDIE